MIANKCIAQHSLKKEKKEWDEIELMLSSRIISPKKLTDISTY